VDDNGDIKAVYRKVHLFKVSIKNGPTLDETRTVDPGTELIVCMSQYRKLTYFFKVVDSPVGKLGLSTCYDVRFPELYVSSHQGDCIKRYYRNTVDGSCNTYCNLH
jgi:predicted amidohydrolase